MLHAQRSGPEKAAEFVPLWKLLERLACRGLTLGFSEFLTLLVTGEFPSCASGNSVASRYSLQEKESCKR